MDDKLFFGARSSLFVSTPALVVFGVLAVAGAVFHLPALCGTAVFFLLLCLVSRLWGEASLGQVEVTCQGQPAALFPPGEVTLRFRIRNNKWLPVIWLEVLQLLDETAPLVPEDPGEICRVRGPQFQLEGVQGEEASFLHKKFTFVMGWEDILWDSRWQARRRGIFYPGRIRLRAGDGFGLTQKERFISQGKDRFVAVYPAPQPVDTSRFLQDMWEASSGAKGYLEDPTIIRSTRDYARTDPFKRINWRLTARSQKPMVNTYETILPKAAYFLLDGESFNGPGRQDDALEDTLSLLTSLILRLREAGILCGVSLPASRSGPAREILGAEETPLEEILLAFAGYELLDLVQPEDPEKPPYAPPAVFHDSRILSLRNVGRFYYVCSAPERVGKQGLLSRLDPARTTLLPYSLPRTGREASLRDFDAVALTTFKRGAGHGT